MSKIDVTGVPDCTFCGVCCFSTAKDYLRIGGADYDRLGDDAERLTIFIENRAYLRIEDGHCAALTYNAKTSQFLCSIYPKRADVCHWLERGSGHCRAERHAKADRGLVMIRKAREAIGLPADPEAKPTKPASAPAKPSAAPAADPAKPSD